MNAYEVKVGERYIYRWSSADGWHFRKYVCEAKRITPTGRVTISYEIKTGRDMVVRTETATVHPRNLLPIRGDSKSGAAHE